MKRAIVLVVALLSAACGGKTITAEEARNAMPGADQARIGTPTGGSALSVSPAGAAFTTAAFASDSIDLARAVNGGVAWTLGIVELVVSLPPTSCTGDTCTWGPGSSLFDVNDWQLTVTKKDTNEYVWGMAGRPKSNPSVGFITIVSGTAFTTGVRHVGNGDLVVDMDAAKALDHLSGDPQQSGKIQATYDNRTAGHVAVTFLGTDDGNNPGQKVNAAYQFDASASGGDLQAATRNLSSNDTFALHSQWNSVGAGRGDAKFQGSQTYTETQCWDGNATTFNLVYQASSPAQLSDTVGVDPSVVCVFPAAPLTIVAP
jgi:hypothetical protein